LQSESVDVERLAVSPAEEEDKAAAGKSKAAAAKTGP
jgi:hypothetical protein